MQNEQKILDAVNYAYSLIFDLVESEEKLYNKIISIKEPGELLEDRVIQKELKNRIDIITSQKFKLSSAYNNLLNLFTQKSVL